MPARACRWINRRWRHQHAFTVALDSLLGTRHKPIAGYPGTQENMLAIERGELDGIVGYSWASRAPATGMILRRAAQDRHAAWPPEAQELPTCRCSTSRD